MIDFQTAFNDLCNEEPWADLTVFFDKYELFEEFPLVSRYKNIATLRKEMRTDNIAEFLINTSFFILTSALLYATKNNIPIDNRFFAITFTDFELSIPGEPPIPSFFIHPDETRNAFLKKLRVHKKHTESNEMLTVKNYLHNADSRTYLNFTRVVFLTRHVVKTSFECLQFFAE